MFAKSPFPCYNRKKRENRALPRIRCVMKEKNLVIMAAGIGSRFKGGVKQLQSVGPMGECIMEYSICDAIEAGFNRIVFIIRKDIEELFNEAIGHRIRRVCADRNVEMICVYQDKYDLPGGFTCPEDRVKPWGTGHAVLACRRDIKGSFVVINADDFYGKEAYVLMSNFLDKLPENSTGVYGLAGFLLENTLSENGGVTRGLCSTDEKGELTGIDETRNIIKTENGPGVKTAEGLRYISGKTPASMNMWAFTPDILQRLEEKFSVFLAEGGIEDLGSEFLIPVEIGRMIEKEEIRVKVLPTSGRWFGMTFSEDLPTVRAALRDMSDRGDYKVPLWE